MAQGDGGAANVVACHLTLAAVAARPGDTVTALLQVSCSLPEAVELQEVEIEFTGIERVDTSWVLPTYRRSTPPINADKRKVQRYVVQSRLQAATQGTFSDLSLRRFVVRFVLPSWLPPTFHGTAVRYVYYVQAVVKYRPAGSSGNGGGGSAVVSGAAAAVPTAGGSVSSRVPLHIWPAKQQQLEGATLDRTSSSLLISGCPPAAGAAASKPVPASDSSLLSPPLQSEDVPIKCWEIGPGTAVNDAVVHIIKLASQPHASPGRPQSPGHLPRSGNGRGTALASGGGGGNSGGGGGGGSSVGGAQSEISYDPEEVDMQPPGSLAAAGAGGAAPVRLTLPQSLQQQEQAAPGPGSSIASGASSPRNSSRLASRRTSLSRPSLDTPGLLAQPRSPTHAALENGPTLRSFALRIGDQPLVRVSLHPPLEGRLQPGATLAGTLDFSRRSLAPAAASAADGGSGGSGGQTLPGPRCMQVLILLETEEVVEAAWRRPAQGGGAGAIRRVYDEHLEVTADTACTHFMFTVPPDAAASFQTPLLQLRWLLRFQFTASLPPPSLAGAGRRAAAEWAPLQGRVEQLTWALPITVVPPPPIA